MCVSQIVPKHTHSSNALKWYSASQMYDNHVIRQAQLVHQHNSKNSRCNSVTNCAESAATFSSRYEATLEAEAVAWQSPVHHMPHLNEQRHQARCATATIYKRCKQQIHAQQQQVPCTVGVYHQQHSAQHCTATATKSYIATSNQRADRERIMCSRKTQAVVVCSTNSELHTVFVCMGLGGN